MTGPTGGLKDHPVGSLLSTLHRLTALLRWWTQRTERWRVVAACVALVLSLLLLCAAVVVFPHGHSAAHPSSDALDAAVPLTITPTAAGVKRPPHKHPVIPLLDPALQAPLPSPSAPVEGRTSDPHAAMADPSPSPPAPPPAARRVQLPASGLRWFAPFTLHPHLLTSVPQPYSYTESSLSTLFELHYVQAPIPRRSLDGTKVVLLLMTRNSGDWLLFFLEHHVDAVDSVVVLDDASTDSTLRLLHRYGPQMKVEVLMRKREWSVMNEWPDRNLLVQAARQAQATHWLMLDIDELLSYNCVRHRPRGLGGVSDDRDEALLSTVFRTLNGSRGELLELEAVELWGNAHQQRVGMMSRWRFATYDQFSHLHPVPIWLLDEGKDEEAFVSRWPPSPLHPISHYSTPPYITQGQLLPNGGSAHVGRIPEPIYQHSLQQRKRRRRGKGRASGASEGEEGEGEEEGEEGGGGAALPVELSQCRVVHHRFVNDFQFVFKGAFYESRGLSHVMEELQAKGEWSVGEPIPPPGRTVLELTKRAYAIMGGVYRAKPSNGSSADDAVVLTSVPADEWLGPSFMSLLPLFMELKPWRVLQMLDAVELYGLELFRECRFMSRIHWKSIVRAEIEEAQQPIYSLPLVKHSKAKGGGGGERGRMEAKPHPTAAQREPP